MAMLYSLFIFAYLIKSNSGSCLGPDANGRVNCPTGVKKINANAYKNNQLVNSVTFNEDLEEIEDYAFSGTNLTSVIFPSSLKKIGAYAFYETKYLTSITLKEGLEEIGTFAFSKGYYGSGAKLTSVIFPSSIKIIRSYAFGSIPTLTSITLNEGLEEIGDSAFNGAKLTSIIFPTSIKKVGGFNSIETLTSITLNEGLEEIGNSAFSLTKLTSVIFPSSLKKIGSSAFGSIPTLTSITLNEGLEEIGDGAFSRTKLTSVIIPSTVKIIRSAFASNMHLASITLKEGAEKITDYAFTETSIDDLTLPSSIRTIGSLCSLDFFNNKASCPNLRNVIIRSTNFTMSPELLLFYPPLQINSVTISSSLISFGGYESPPYFHGFQCDLISTCICNVGYGCEFSESGSFITASKCSPGSYKDVLNRNVCTECPTGKYMKPYIDGSVSSSQCITCPAGTYTDRNGSTSCSPSFLLSNQDIINLHLNMDNKVSDIHLNMDNKISDIIKNFTASINEMKQSFASSPVHKNEENLKGTSDITGRQIATAALVIGSFSFVINVFNFIYLLKNRPRYHIDG